MVKARVRAVPEKNDDLEQRVKAFADRADLPAETEAPAAPAKDAKRDFKALNLPLNEYEYAVLEKLCKKLSRTKSNLLRYALLELARREEIE